MLENYGYRVVTATNGLEGISVFNQHEETIHLVVSDMDMPYMGGLEVAAALRRKRPGLPFILISGTESSEGDFDGIDRENFGFLVKPYTVEGLIREVGRHTGAVPPPRWFRCGRWLLRPGWAGSREALPPPPRNPRRSPSRDASITHPPCAGGRLSASRARLPSWVSFPTSSAF